VSFNPDLLTDRPNLLASLSPTSVDLVDVIHVSDTTGIEVASDIGTQLVVCR
jgi:hypothetical protein